MYKAVSKSTLIILLLILLGGALRVYNLNWDFGHFLHPDERLYVNASSLRLPESIDSFFSPESPLNPKMFYYGSFPLYLYKILHVLLNQTIDFLFLSRLISALFSTATIPLIYFLGKKIFSERIGLIAAVTFTFAAGSIQHAHFNTTESMLLFLISLITFLSINAVKEKKYFVLPALGALVGTSIATKITGASFGLLPFLSVVYLSITERNVKKMLAWLSPAIILGVFLAIALAPYQLIAFEQFYHEQEYMQGVILGRYKPPFTIIYEGTLPYLYPLVRVFPFVFGFLSFPLALIGLVILLKQLIFKPKTHHIYLFILLFPLIYFLVAGAWYAKFARYYILLLPFVSLWAAVALEKFNKYILLVLLGLIIINGTLYARIYTTDHTRIEASKWIYQNLPDRAILAGEHWDDNLPLPMDLLAKPDFTLTQLLVYNPDSQEKIATLSREVARADYIIISSRRVYYSILQNKKMYPLTNRFYDQLFAGELGYSLHKTFTHYPFYFSDDSADESFQSYDHPPVLIFKNEQKLSEEVISASIKE